MAVVETYCLYPLRVCEVRSLQITEKRLRKSATPQPLPPRRHYRRKRLSLDSFIQQCIYYIISVYYIDLISFNLALESGRFFWCRGGFIIY